MSAAEFAIPPMVGAQEERIYLRDQPEDWRRLFEIAENFVNPNLPYDEQIRAAGIMLDEVLRMPTEEMEAARYYSAGLITCLVAQELVLPGKRDELAEAAAAGIVAEH